MRKSTLMGIVALSLLFSCSAPSVLTEEHAATPVVDVHELLMTGAVEVETGTGFAIARIKGNTYVLTCWHVVRGSGKAKVTVHLPKTKSEEGLVYSVDPENDLALVLVKMELPIFEIMSVEEFWTLKELRPNPDDPEHPLKGEKIWSAGYPINGLRPALTTFGNVIKLQAYVNAKKGVYHDCAGWYGFSGGPIINKAGKVIGVTARIIWKEMYPQSNQMWSVPVPAIQKFLKGAGIAP